MDERPRSNKPIRIVYFGTPRYAAPTLLRLASDQRFEVVMVVTQPDRPAGRGRVLQSSVVKTLALELGFPVYQPESLRTAEQRAPLAAVGADLFVVAAYGLIFGPRLLAIPRLGCLNLHASLLPKYRGASPVTAAILEGDPVTGVTLMQMDTGLDTGPSIASVDVSIAPDATTQSLTVRLAEAGAELAMIAIVPFTTGALTGTSQPSAGASVVRPLVKADGWVDWSLNAGRLVRHVRAMWDWPRAFTTLNGNLLQMHRASVAQVERPVQPGEVAINGNEVFVGAGIGTVRLDVVQLPGERPTSAFDLARRRQVIGGDLLGATGRPENMPPIVSPVGRR